MGKSSFSIYVIGRLKKTLGLRTDVELAEYLGVKHNTISGWKARNTLDDNRIIAICDRHHISFDWLFSETGSMFKKRNASQRQTPSSRRAACCEQDLDVLSPPTVTLSGNLLAPTGAVEEFPAYFAENVPLSSIRACTVPEGWLLTMPKIGPGDRLLLAVYESPARLSALYRQGRLHEGYALVSRGQILTLKLLEEVGPSRIALLNLPGETDAYALNLDEGDDGLVYARVLWILSVRFE